MTQQYLSDLAAAGYKNVALDDAIALRDHAVTASFLQKLKAHGYANVPVRDLIRLRSEHPVFCRRRWFQ